LEPPWLKKFAEVDREPVRTKLELVVAGEICPTQKARQKRGLRMNVAKMQNLVLGALGE
jgi:hypothetical protein